jgi:hypothetical protein
MATRKSTLIRRANKPATFACRTCAVVLPFDLEHFPPRPTATHGLRIHCRKCLRDRQNRWCRLDRMTVRLEALTHYSGGEPACACCGEARYEFLAVDHLTGSSHEDQERFGSLDKHLVHLRREGWPEGYQVLCHNCNAAKSIYGTTGRLCCVHHPEQRPVDFVRKGGRSNAPLVPIPESRCNDLAVQRCQDCQRLFPLDSTHFFYRKDNQRYRYECKECYGVGRLDVLRANRLRNKMKAMSHYCGGAPKCQCCGIEAVELLTIDHVNGGGAKHREEAGFSDICLWLLTNGLPDGFRVLCYNCNMAAYKFNGCPHVTDVDSAAEIRAALAAREEQDSERLTRRCIVPGCDGPQVLRQMCRNHYANAYRKTTRGPQARPTPQCHLPCRAEGCTSLGRKRGLCGKHYQQVRAVEKKLPG